MYSSVLCFYSSFYFVHSTQFMVLLSYLFFFFFLSLPATLQPEASLLIEFTFLPILSHNILGFLYRRSCIQFYFKHTLHWCFIISYKKTVSHFILRLHIIIALNVIVFMLIGPVGFVRVAFSEVTIALLVVFIVLSIIIFIIFIFICLF